MAQSVPWRTQPCERWPKQTSTHRASNCNDAGDDHAWRANTRLRSEALTGFMGANKIHPTRDRPACTSPRSTQPRLHECNCYIRSDHQSKRTAESLGAPLDALGAVNLAIQAGSNLAHSHHHESPWRRPARSAQRCTPYGGVGKCEMRGDNICYINGHLRRALLRPCSHWLKQPADMSCTSNMTARGSTVY